MKRVLLGAAVGFALVLNGPAAYAAEQSFFKLLATCDEGSEDCGWCAKYGDQKIVCTP